MSLRDLLRQPGILQVPGVFDGVSTRLAVQAGFPALYMTGYGAVASGYGLPDVGLATYSEMVSRVEVLCGLSPVPVIADGDTGYGSLATLRRAVQGYERAGAAAIQIEDQCFPKLCGHAGTPAAVVDSALAVRRIAVAVACRQSDDFLVVARTDARRAHGLDEALRRASLFLEAGADVLFVESPETPKEMRRIGEVFRGVPLIANLVPGGRTPMVTAAELESFGYTVALRPVDALLAATRAMADAYASLRMQDAGSAPVPPATTLAALSGLMGFDDVQRFDAKWSGETP